MSRTHRRNALMTKTNRVDSFFPVLTQRKKAFARRPLVLFSPSFQPGSPPQVLCDTQLRNSIQFGLPPTFRPPIGSSSPVPVSIR